MRKWFLKPDSRTIPIYIVQKKIQKLLLDLHLEISIVDWCRAIYKLIQVKVTLKSHLLIILGNLKVRKIWIQKKNIISAYVIIWWFDDQISKCGWSDQVGKLNTHTCSCIWTSQGIREKFRRRMGWTSCRRGIEWKG